ncbi:MAG TPA: Gfo/Idh/MocA family oxidoreductase [Polyangiaceae bacterium]|nr:Gfo/Idh/MocA family oxidoreductase [Polyangiaceae bacterium]
MKTPVRFGVVGAGQIGHYACDEIGGHADAKVVAAADVNQQRLDELGQKFDIERRYLDPEALLADEGVDAVYIATPNAYHAPLALAALEQGKHVILEKPFALNAAEAQAVVSSAAQRKLWFTVGMNQRFRADSQKVRELVRRGDLGEVYNAKSFWFRRTGIPKLGTWFGKKALSGGGSLLDIGVHLLDLALFVMDEFKPTSVFGQTYTKFGNRGLGEGGWGFSDRTESGFDVDDLATALIKFESGRTLGLDVSWAIHQADGNRMNVLLHGTDGGAGCYPAELYKPGEPGGEYQVLKELDIATPFAHESRFHNFVNVILEREPLCVTPEQALVVQRILDAIYQSSQTGKEVILSGTPERNK